MELTHEQIGELLGVYALDAVEADEKDAVERHLSECPRCAAEVAEHREVAAKLAYSGAPAPDGIWTRIVESLEETPPALTLPVSSPTVAPEAADNVVSLAGRRGIRQWLPLGAVAAALVVVGLIAGVLIGGSDSGQSGTTDLAQASIEDIARRAINDPRADTVTLASLDDPSLEVKVAIERDGSGYLLGMTLPALDASQTYQLWGIRGGGEAVVSLGLLGHSPGAVAFHVDDNIEALAITAEVAGGVPISSNPALLVGNLA